MTDSQSAACTLCRPASASAASRDRAGAALTMACGRPASRAARAHGPRPTTRWRIIDRSPSVAAGWRRYSSALTTTPSTLSPRNSRRS